MPDPDLVTGDGATRLSALVRDGHRVLLQLDNRTPPPIHGWDDRVRHVTAKAAGGIAADAVPIRPGGHVCWASPSPTGLPLAPNRWFAAPTHRERPAQAIVPRRLAI